MVESISPIAVSKVEAPPVAPTRVAALPPVQRVASDAATEVPTTRSTAKTLAASAPLDMDRVQRIKTAITNGTFPISPAKIADQLIALRYEWMSNDQA